jgi:hypothetical protein
MIQNLNQPEVAFTRLRWVSSWHEFGGHFRSLPFSNNDWQHTCNAFPGEFLVREKPPSKDRLLVQAEKEAI